MYSAGNRAIQIFIYYRISSSNSEVKLQLGWEKKKKKDSVPHFLITQ